MTLAINRVVIVEDDPQVGNLIHLVLCNCGARHIVMARNGAEAIDALKADGADIVIMGRKMEGMDGLECTRLIRAGIEGIDPETPIILLTWDGSGDGGIAAEAAGTDHFIELPLSMKLLYAQLNKALHG